MEDWRAAKANGPLGGQQLIQQAVSKLAPNAMVFTKQDNLGVLQTQQNQQTRTPAPSSDFDKFGAFAGTVAGQAGDLEGGFASYIFNSAVEAVEAPFKLAYDYTKEVSLSMDVDANQKQLTMLSAKSSQLSADYRSGRITRDQYKEALKQQSDDLQEATKRSDENIASLNQNAQDTASSFISTAEDVLAIVTAGASTGITALAVDGAKVAGDGSGAAMINFFGKKEVSEAMFTAASKIDSIVAKAAGEVNKVSTFNGKFPTATIVKISGEAATNGTSALTAKQIATNVATNLILKKPLIYQTNIDLATNIYSDMQKGDLSGAALSTVLTATMALSGGPVGASLEFLGRGFSWLRAASFTGGNVGELLKAENAANVKNGTAALVTKEIIDANAKTSVSQQSYIDALSTHIGNGEPSQIYIALTRRAAAGDIASHEMIKVSEEVNMKMAGGNSVRAAGFVADWFNGLDGGKWLRSATADDVIDSLINHVAAREAVVQDAIKGGMSKAMAQRIVIGRANRSDLELISDIVLAADKAIGSALRPDGSTDFEIANKLIQARLAVFQQAIDRYGRTAAWANSDTFVTQMREIIGNNIAPDKLSKEIKSIRVGNEIGDEISDDVKKELSKKGYIAILPKDTHTPYIEYENTNKVIKSSYADRTNDLYAHAVSPVPVLASVSNLLTRIGLSPEASMDAVQDSFQSNFADLMQGATNKLTSDIKYRDSKNILSQLYSHIKDTNNLPGLRAPIVDLRQLRKKEIATALGIDESEAKVVMRSLNTAMLKVPVAIRGLGDKLQDVNIAINPLAAPFARLQGASRFVWNPFFRWQQTYQTEGLAQLEAGGKPLQLPYLNAVNRILFRGQAKETADTVKMLEGRSIFGAGYSGIGATGDVQGQIGTRIIKSEKVSLAGLVNKQAKNAGMSPADFIDSNQSAVVDTLRMITTNNHTQGFLDSPLARTINTVFFPFRYNMKVANLMAGYIGKFSAPTQVALISSLLDAHDWLQSDPGIAWQQQYSEAIGLFNWLSPTYPLTYIFKLGEDVVDPQDPQIGDLGLLGGLPFGMISQILESNGIIETSSPYLNPKTGDVYPKYVPNSAKGQVNLAIQDFIGSLFSYPGAIVGLPGKGQEIRGIVNSTVGGGKDFNQIDESGNLNAVQQHRQQVLQGNAGVSPLPQSSTVLAPGGSDITTLPQPDVSTAPRETSSTARRKKKSEYRPVPLP